MLSPFCGITFAIVHCNVAVALCSTPELLAAYRESCKQMGVKPMNKLIQQLEVCMNMKIMNSVFLAITPEVKVLAIAGTDLIQLVISATATILSLLLSPIYPWD